MKKLVLLLDVDDVVCFSGFLELVNEFLNSNYKIDDFSDYYIDAQSIPEERMDDFNKFICSKDQYANPVFLPGALDAIKKLSEYYDIYICSDCRNPFDLGNSGRIYSNKFAMLYKYIPQDIIPAKQYIFTGSKKIIKADAQVDDLYSNLNPEIECKILFPSYHNKNIDYKDALKENIFKAGNDWRTGWEFALEILIKYANKKMNLK